MNNSIEWIIEKFLVQYGLYPLGILANNVDRKQMFERYYNFLENRYIYFGHFPPPLWGGGEFCPNWKTGKNLKEDLKKEGKGGKRRKKEESDKTYVKIPICSLNDRKKIHKNREEF